MSPLTKLHSTRSFQVSASQLRHRVSIIRDALFGLQMNLDILYHHYSAMVDNKLTPEMISPKNLYDILQDVQNEIRDHPRLSLPEELSQNTIYKFYKIVRFEVTMEQKLMLGVLQVPLIEKNKQFQLFKIYNLPIPLPKANLQVQYDLTFKYLAITTGAQYVAFPKEEEIMGCQLTGEAFCESNTALFPTIGLTSYEFALYQKDHEWIIEACRVRTTPFISDQALSLEPNFLVVITQKPIVLHINCLQCTSYQKVQHPINIIHLEDGCEATSATLVLPGHSHLIKEDNYLARTHSVKFKLQYTEIQDFRLLKQIFPCQLSSKELEKIGNSIPEPQSSSITKLQGQLKFINTNYPHSMPLFLKIVIACSSTAIVIIVIYVTYRYHKYGCTKGLLKPLCRKKCKQLMKTSNLSTTPALSEFISDANKLTWRTRHLPRSSVVIQEMELQPMVPPVSTVHGTPAIKAADMNKRILHKDVVKATLDNVAKALEPVVGLNFNQYYEKKQLRTKRKGTPPTP